MCGIRRDSEPRFCAKTVLVVITARKTYAFLRMPGFCIIASTKNKKHTRMGVLFVWRRRRDSNPRTAFNSYTISNRARSTSYATSPGQVGVPAERYAIIMNLSTLVKVEMTTFLRIFKIVDLITSLDLTNRLPNAKIMSVDCTERCPSGLRSRS